MKKRPGPSLAFLAGSSNPLEDIDKVVRRLRAEAKESRYLEWKTTPPLGPTVSQRTKYRTVKAAISFANADGGFIVFGVDSKGQWIGLDRKALEIVDPAHIVELINGCVFPDIQLVNFSDFERNGSAFAVLHIPPSSIAPHVTTKDIFDKDDSGKLRVILNKHIVYYRQGAKSDLATPLQHSRIVGRRVDNIRDDLVRRVREVTIPVASSQNAQGRFGVTSITVARLSKDPNASPVRITRSRDGTTGTLLHEELSDGLFEEINNVVDANSLLNKGRTKPRFLLGDPIYYRIYSERHHIEQSDERMLSLLTTGFAELYAPFLFWVLKLSPESVAELVKSVAVEQRSLQTYSLMRLVTLLGPRSSDWLWEIFQKKYGKETQPPEFYWAFKEIRGRLGDDRRLVALGITKKSAIPLAGSMELSVDRLLQQSAELPNYLSKACFEVFTGSKELRTTARTLDILTYGKEVEARSSAIEKALLAK